MERNFFFSRDSEAAFGSERATREARFGPELDWEKAWRGQVFGDPEARERKGDREVGWDESQMGKSCGGARCSEPGWAQERKEKFFVLFSGARCSGPG